MIHAMPVSVARVSLPIRRPRREVFLAFTDPDMLSRFWPHCAGTEPLEQGTVTEGRMHETADPVTVECAEMIPDRLIRLSLSNGVRIVLTLDRFDEAAKIAIAREQHGVVEPRGHLHHVDGDLDIHIALHADMARGIGKAPDRFGHGGEAIVAQPVHQRTHG